MQQLITPLILTYNEKENIGRVLKQLTWAEEVVVVDSFSTDGTLDILETFPNVSIHQNKFLSFADQCNFGLSLIRTEYVLSLDADYIVTDELIQEIFNLNTNDTSGYNVPFKYCIYGQPLTGTVLPSRTVLYKRNKAKYEKDGHAHRVAVEGNVEKLQNFIHHDDRKPLSRWLQSQDKYMIQEVNKMSSETSLSFPDRIRKKIFFAPLLMFFFCLFIKGGILDGKKGWYYAYQRLLAESLLSLRLLEHHLFHPSKK